MEPQPMEVCVTNNGNSLTMRRWLNGIGHHTIAAVFAEIEGGYGNVIIQDCNRSITLSMEMDCCKDLFNTLNKIDGLVEVLLHMRTAFVKSIPKKIKRLKENIRNQDASRDWVKLQHKYIKDFEALNEEDLKWTPPTVKLPEDFKL